MRQIGRLSRIALNAEACRFMFQAVGEREASKAEMLEWIEFFERVQLDGAASLRGVYGAPNEGVVPLRVIGSVN